MKNKSLISKDILIEELVRDYPVTVEYLMKNGIRCLICGEPAWGTLESAALEKGFGKKEIEIFVQELNKIISS